MRKLVILISILTFSLLQAQSRIAKVNHGAHLIKTTDWSKFKTKNLLVEKTDGTKKKIYPYNSDRPTNPSAIYIEGLADDFEQGDEVKVYVLKPEFSHFKSLPIQAKVNNGAHLIKTMDWTEYRNKTIMIEEINGLNQNIYNFTDTRPINPNAMYVKGIDQDYEQNTDVNVYIVEDFNFKNGNVGIGTTDTKGYKLGVNGKVIATEIKVETYSNWSDFVFEENYELPNLKEVENYIKEKGHLKNIPSAKEVEENGFFLGEMDAKLLQKIEELTLYTIEQEKKLNHQNSKIEKLEQENNLLKSLLKRVSKLEEKLEEKLENK